MKKTHNSRTRASDRVAADSLIGKQKRKLTTLSANYRHAIDKIHFLEDELEAKRVFSPITPVIIKPHRGLGSSEATAVVVIGDWHLEELVKPESVSDLNSFNKEIAEKRIRQVFFTAVKLIKIYRRDIPIRDVVVLLLGDFITGNIHEELIEIVRSQPIDAILEAQQKLADGLQYMLSEIPDAHFTVMCKPGNHSRITKAQRYATESGNSLETFMYENLARSFRKTTERIQFVIPRSYLGYLKIYEWTICAHHGSAIRYQGGIGGLFIPAYKAVSQWEKAIHADLHVFGHWHQLRDGGNFICNGSLIGYNAYAVQIKADFEKPKQLFFLMDKRRGRTAMCPIVLDD